MRTLNTAHSREGLPGKEFTGPSEVQTPGREEGREERKAEWDGEWADGWGSSHEDAG